MSRCSAVIRYVLLILGGLWAVLFIDAWRLGQPMTLARTHRLRIFGLTGVLAIGTSAAVLVAANAVGSIQIVVSDVFTGGGAGERDGRYNILLLGGDAGEDRDGLRPDSITVASVDAETGASILFGLPRNMQNVPFTEDSPMHDEWPDGFDCGDECLLNGVYTWAEDHADLFEGEDRPGVAATQSAVEAITGLEISYTALIDLQGFEQLVNAVGGVTINVGKRVPIGIEQRPDPGVDRDRRAEDGRRHGAVVRPVAARQQRLRADGPAEMRDVGDAQADRPADGADQLPVAGGGFGGDDLDRRAGDGSCRICCRSPARRAAQAPVSVSFVPPLVEPVHPNFRRDPADWSRTPSIRRSSPRQATVEPSARAAGESGTATGGAGARHPSVWAKTRADAAARSARPSRVLGSWTSENSRSQTRTS